MMDKTREERIKELKALRGELLAYKAAQEENEGSGENNTSLHQARTLYKSDYQSRGSSTDSQAATSELKSQYQQVKQDDSTQDSDEKTQEQQYRRVLRR